MNNLSTKSVKILPIHSNVKFSHCNVKISLMSTRSEKLCNERGFFFRFTEVSDDTIEQMKSGCVSSCKKEKRAIFSFKRRKAYPLKEAV